MTVLLPSPVKEFKFTCPSCQQKIEVEVGASGRQFACPGCRSELIVPAPPKQPGQLPAAILAQVKQRVQSAETSSLRIEVTSKVSPSTIDTKVAPRLEVKKPDPAAAVQPTPAVRVASEPTEHPEHAEGSTVPAKKQLSNKIDGPKQAAGGKAPELQPVQTKKAASTRPDSSLSTDDEASKEVKLVAATEEKPGGPALTDPTPGETPLPQEMTVQIASLTPAIKRDMVRSIRRRLADEAHWMPGVSSEGKYAYAAKDVDGNRVPVEATSPEATHFSILGASLAELQLRNVTRTASGRVEFLDQELLEAIRQAAGEAIAEREAGPGPASTPEQPAPLISHAQSLKALDLLEERYTRELEDPAGAARGRPEDLRMAHLTRKLQRKESVGVEEICAALANELKEINERLTALERTAGQGRHRPQT
jgi:hypothetical protein